MSAIRIVLYMFMRPYFHSDMSHTFWHRYVYHSKRAQQRKLKKFLSNLFGYDE